MSLMRAASAMSPLLRLFEPEAAHRLALQALRLGLAGSNTAADPKALSVHALGLHFSNPIGLAAGFDKNAVAVLPLLRLGFGFVETGTVTPRPQPGNPRPRLFRLDKERAVINRLGFNNSGLTAYRSRLAAVVGRRGPVGANIGINKEGAEPERDYSELVAAVAPFADYITINVSSPNTPGLRDLQGDAQLAGILRAILARNPIRPPLLIKLAPDIADERLASIIDIAAAGGADGLIISNTTISRRAGLRGRHASQPGGLSGPPLFDRATAMLRAAWRLSRGRLTLIGCGGVETGEQVLEKIRAGASLVQLYTAFAYDGPALIPRLKIELLEALHRQGFASVIEALGTDG